MPQPNLSPAGESCLSRCLTLRDGTSILMAPPGASLGGSTNSAPYTLTLEPLDQEQTPSEILALSSPGGRASRARSSEAEGISLCMHKPRVPYPGLL
jgi:hypothetical protein